jgi:DivIVA domain-containing protein
MVMVISPMDIHLKEFSTVSTDGYNKEEVDSFLGSVADELERLANHNKELEGMVSGMEQKVSQFDEMQQTLQNALMNAQRSAGSILQEARSQAAAIIKKAQDRSRTRRNEEGAGATAGILFFIHGADRGTDTPYAGTPGEKPEPAKGIRGKNQKGHAERSHGDSFVKSGDACKRLGAGPTGTRCQHGNRRGKGRIAFRIRRREIRLGIGHRAIQGFSVHIKLLLVSISAISNIVSSRWP